MAKDYPAWGDDFDRDDFLRDLDAAAIRYLSENSDDILGRLDSLPINQLLSLPFHVPYGPLQIAIWEECVKRQELMAPADTAGPAAARLNLVDALAMGGQLHRVPAVFELVEDYYYDSWGVEQHPEFLEHFAWHYRNYIQALTDDPTTPADDLHAALGRMKELYILLNDDMKSYYLRAYQVHKELGEEQEAAELRELWINTPPSKLSDCTGCDPVYVVKMHAAIGDWGQAVAVGEKALENPDLLCDAQPENLYLSLLTPWLRTGADCVAIEAHLDALTRDIESPIFLDHFPDHFVYLGLSGAAGRPLRLELGLVLFSRYVQWWKQAESPRVLMNLAASVAFFLDQLPNDDRQLGCTLDGSELPWGSAPDIEGPTVAQAREWCANIALGLAQQFDARPGIRFPHTVAEITYLMDKTPPIAPLKRQSRLERMFEQGQILVANNAVTRAGMLKFKAKTLYAFFADFVDRRKK